MVIITPAKPLKWLAAFGCAIIFGLIFAYTIYPFLLHWMLTFQRSLTTKGDSKKMWETTPYPFGFNVYIFNYTNPEEVQRGGIPIVEEIGPYCFEEWKVKVDVKLEQNDTISFKRMKRFQFDREHSRPGLTGDELVVLPHPFLMSMVQAVAIKNPLLLDSIDKAINIFSTDGIFIKANAMDLLFNCIIINCDQKDEASKKVCAELRNYAGDDLAFRKNNKHRFSLFGWRNFTDDKHVITIKRGKTNILNLGQVVSVDGKKEMDIWRDSCNEYQGTGELIFPPFETEFDKLKIFEADFCRFLELTHKKVSSFATIKVNQYNLSIGDLATDPELNCYCDTPNDCPPKGFMDLTKCIGRSMLISLPHFLDCDPELLNDVIGLSPNEKRHESEIDLEPLSGTPVRLRRTIQFNIRLKKIEQISVMRNLPGTIAPLYWINESYILNKTFINLLNYKIFLPIALGKIIQWFCIVGGFIGCTLTLIWYAMKDTILSALGLKNNSETIMVAKDDYDETEKETMGVEDLF